jgi:hypothetical protein
MNLFLKCKFWLLIKSIDICFKAMKIFYCIMKNFSRICPLSYVALLSIFLVISCKFKTDNNVTAYSSFERPLYKRELTAIQFCDNASDTPAIVNYKIDFNIKDSTTGSLNFINYLNHDSTKNAVSLTPERIDELSDYVTEFSKMPDNWVVRPGKMICTEKNNALVQMIFNNGDTTNYIINASARCDPQLFRTWHKIDSMRRVIFENVQ